MFGTVSRCKGEMRNADNWIGCDVNEDIKVKIKNVTKNKELKNTQHMGLI